jgi:large subunit ribosomal protein L29
MKAAKWRELSGDEVQQKVRELSEEIFNLRFQLSMGVAKNPSRVNHARKDLARAYTILKEQGVAAPVITAPVTAVEPKAAARAEKTKAARAKKAGGVKQATTPRAAKAKAKPKPAKRKTKKG